MWCNVWFVVYHTYWEILIRNYISIINTKFFAIRQTSQRNIITNVLSDDVNDIRHIMHKNWNMWIFNGIKTHQFTDRYLFCTIILNVFCEILSKHIYNINIKTHIQCFLRNIIKTHIQDCCMFLLNDNFCFFWWMTVILQDSVLRRGIVVR